MVPIKGTEHVEPSPCRAYDTRKRPRYPSTNSVKRCKLTDSTEDTSSTSGESDSVPDLVPGSVFGDFVIDPICVGESLFNFLIFPLSITIFGRDYYGLEPFHSIGGKKRCNLDCILPIQKLDDMISTERLFFGKDIEFINSPSNFSGRAYRSKVWSDFVDGTSVRFLLPERYFIRFGVEIGLLQDIFNGPIYSIATFIANPFKGPLIDPMSPNCPPGDIFILLVENCLTVTATLSPDESTLSGLSVKPNAKRSWEMKAGDVLYLPASYSHEVKLDDNYQHAIALCIVNRTPILIKEWGNRLMDIMKVPRAFTHKSLFRQLLDSTNDSDSKGSSLYIELNEPAKIFDAVRKWLVGDGTELDSRDAETVMGAVAELQKEFISKTPLMWLNCSERDFHVTTRGACWVDPNYVTGEEDETIDRLRRQAGIPRLEGKLYLEDLDLDLCSFIRIARRSAICIVEEPADPTNVYLYHTLSNSIDARVENELCALKLPRNDVILSMMNKLVKNFPQSTSVDELAEGSEEAKTRLFNMLFDNGLIVITPFFECEGPYNAESSKWEIGKESDDLESVVLEGDGELKRKDAAHEGKNERMR